MADRIRIGGVHAPAPPSITQQSENVAFPVPEVKSAAAGLEGLSSALSQFFGGVGNAIGTMMQAHHAVTMADIRQENDEQSAKGVADAYNAKSMGDIDPYLSGDRDYYDSFSKTLAAKTGSDLANQFIIGLSQKPLDGTDPQAELDSFLKTNLKNGDGFGTGNHVFDAVLLDSVYKGTENAVNAFKLDQVKLQFQKGRENLDAYIHSTWTRLDSGWQVQSLMKHGETLSPEDPKAGRAFVIASMIDSAGAAPKEGQKLLRLLSEPGSGDGNRSFKEMFPAAYNDVDEKLAQKFKSDITVEGQQAYDGIEKLKIGRAHV